MNAANTPRPTGGAPSGLLAGLRVIEAGQLLAGPFVVMWLVTSISVLTKLGCTTTTLMPNCFSSIRSASDNASMACLVPP